MDKENKGRHDPQQPYTLHHGNCGEEGEYLHIPDTLLLSFDNLDPSRKQVFGEYKFGLFL